MNPDEVTGAEPAEPKPSVTSELTFRAAQAITSGSVESCYDAGLVRAMAVAHESNKGSEAAKVVRRLKAKFGKELNSNHLRDAVAEFREELRRDVSTGRTGYILTADGGLRGNLANAITMMEGLPIAYNSFSCRAYLTEPSPWGTKGNWTDYDDTKSAEWCQRAHLNIEKGTAADAADAVARGRQPQSHPIREYLMRKPWDGEARLDMWLHDYLGVANNAYTRAVASKWMMSAVNRVMNPGCQADYTLVLEGSQGARKSTALRTLCGEWFSDDVTDIGTKDSAMQLQGKWIVEISELDAFRRAEMTTIKAWLVRREDHFRPPYGRRAEDFPRQNVFAASTNKDDWGLDDTGLRRFWPVKIGAIDIDGLKKNRDELWFEAFQRLAEGETTFMPENLEIEAGIEQNQRQDQDAWKDLIEEWARYPVMRAGGGEGEAFGSGRGRIFLPEILWHCLAIPKKDWSQGHKMRISRILTLAGWLKRREAKGEGDGHQREYWTAMKEGNSGN